MIYRCRCTTPSAATCVGDDTFEPRDADGCGCVCHGEYQDDPENWQPLAVSLFTFADELEGMDDVDTRIERAEELL